MRYRSLGRTGLKVSVIGFGASALGDVFGALAPQAAFAAVNVAVDHGINIFDVSPYYGSTLAEERLGNALKGRREKIVLATKCGRYGIDRFDFSSTGIIRGFEQSLRRLRTDHVDLLQAHDVEFTSIHQILEETLPTMRTLQKEGKVRFIGVTGYWPGFLAQIARAAPVDSILNYCHSNLLMDDMDRELTPMCSEREVGLLNASPLHMGLLGGDTIPAWHPAPQRVKRVAQQVAEVCQQRKVSLPILALHSCLQHPTVASTFIGFKSAAQVQESLRALDLTPDADLLDTLRAFIRPVLNTVWSSGLAENQPSGSEHAN